MRREERREDYCSPVLPCYRGKITLIFFYSLVDVFKIVLIPILVDLLAGSCPFLLHPSGTTVLEMDNTFSIGKR